MSAVLIDRRHQQEVRRQAETLLRRAHFLDPDDRHLVRQVVGKDVRPVEVAAVAGTSTRSIQRRVQSLLRRLADPAVVCIIRHHREWPAPLGRLALDLFVRGRTFRDAAAAHKLTLHDTRKHAEAIRGLIEKRLAGGNHAPPDTSVPLSNAGPLTPARPA